MTLSAASHRQDFQPGGYNISVHQVMQFILNWRYVLIEIAKLLYMPKF